MVLLYTLQEFRKLLQCPDSVLTLAPSTGCLSGSSPRPRTLSGQSTQHRLACPSASRQMIHAPKRTIHFKLHKLEVRSKCLITVLKKAHSPAANAKQSPRNNEKKKKSDSLLPSIETIRSEPVDVFSIHFCCTGEPLVRSRPKHVPPE